MRVVRPKPSPAVLLLLPAGASEASRFSCMKLPGVSGVYDYAEPRRNSRYRSRPYCLPPMQKRQRPDCIFSELNTQPTCTPVYASLNTSRCATQNSGPSGLLLLSRRTLAFPASCRFIPAHCIGLLSTTDTCRSESATLHDLRLVGSAVHMAERSSRKSLKSIELSPRDPCRCQLKNIAEQSRRHSVSPEVKSGPRYTVSGSRRRAQRRSRIDRIAWDRPISDGLPNRLLGLMR